MGTKGWRREEGKCRMHDGDHAPIIIAIDLSEVGSGDDVWDEEGTVEVEEK